MKYIGLVLACLICGSAFACTSAIISGRVTKDGRPVMWKNRDTGNLRNCVHYYRGERFDYIAIVDSRTVEVPNSVWMGTNRAGFSIMNTMSYNLRESDDSRTGKNNGSLMKRALEVCATIEDFKHLLDTLARPLYVCSNYGVIDAEGGAAYFETRNDGYVKYDVNDPSVAPSGYLVRTNYSLSGKENVGMGYVRYLQADAELGQAVKTKAVTPQWLFNHLSRSFVNPLMGIDLSDGRFNKPHTAGWFCEQDFIARRKSSCAVAIEGVKPGEAPELTTMWTAIGYPPVSPAIPLWLKGAAESGLPDGVSYSAACGDAPFCHQADRLRRQVYSYKQGDNALNYFNWELLFNQEKSGWMQRTSLLENKLFEYYGKRVNRFHKKGKLDEKVVREIYTYADEMITDYYKQLLDE